MSRDPVSAWDREALTKLRAAVARRDVTAIRAAVEGRDLDAVLQLPATACSRIPRGPARS